MMRRFGSCGFNSGGAGDRIHMVAWPVASDSRRASHLRQRRNRSPVRLMSTSTATPTIGPGPFMQSTWPSWRAHAECARSSSRTTTNRLPGTAYLVRQVVPDIEVFGGIALNLTVGGINPAAVEHMSRMSGNWGRVVWMPTFDAENQVRTSKENRPYVSVSRNGELLPEVKSVIALIAKHGLVLATGHSTPAEGLMLLREARQQGVRQMIVTHAINSPVQMNTAQLKEAASLGAFIEFVGGAPEGQGAAARLDGIARAIREVGAASSILSSDLGQQGNPLPPDGFGTFIQALRSRGFSDRDLDTMSKQNPAKLLGLP